MNSETPSLAIVVASCDKYSDLWEPLFGQFFKHWPDCPYPIYLVANNKTFDHPKVHTLLAGDDLDWSTTISKAISGLEQSHLMFWIDDAFLDQDVNSIKIQKLFNFVVDEKAQFLRLRSNPTPAKWLNPEFGILDKTAAYRVSLFATIWTKQMLLKILKPGESAWQFELNGTERSREFEDYYCTKAEIFSYLHGVERGIWILPTAQKLSKLGYVINPSKRGVMTASKNLGLQYRIFKSWVFHQIPEAYREKVMAFVRQIYKVVGLR